MHRTFTRNEYKEVIIVRHLTVRGFDEEYDYLEDYLSDALSWDVKLSGINHLLSIILEQFEKRGVPTQQVIDFVYSMEGQFDFEIQEGEIRYIDSLYSNEPGTSLTLEEELISAENRIYALR
jgi:hypothetical protein